MLVRGGFKAGVGLPVLFSGIFGYMMLQPYWE